MAEILGIVASAAGLAPLSMQINESLVRLKSRHAAIKQLPETLEKLERNLVFLKDMRAIMEDRGHCVDSTTTGTLLQTCISDCNAVSAGLNSLEAKISAPRKGKLRVRGLSRNDTLLGEIQTLDQLISRANEHFTMYEVNKLASDVVGTDSLLGR
jgi:hypothetical protein